MKNNNEVKLKLIERDGLRCAMTGEAVKDPNDLVIHHILPASKGGTDDLDNLILVNKIANLQFSSDERKRARYLLEELENRRRELAAEEEKKFERDKAYRKQLESQQVELEHFRHTLRKEQAEREAAYQAELASQRHALGEQQARLLASEAEFTERMRLIEFERSRLEQERRELEDQKALAHEELKREKQKYTEESRKNIERSSTAYVNEALAALDSAATNYHDIARNWSLGGVVSLALGVGVAAYFTLAGLLSKDGTTSTEWSALFLLGLKGIIVVVLLISIAKYCYGYSQSFMHESLKNSERKHAINFGRFYLQSYGANAEWSQVKEAFEHWNISPSSAFSKADSDVFDPKPLERAAQLLESVGKLRFPKQESEPGKNS